MKSNFIVNTEYDYDIDASMGDILSYNYDAENYAAFISTQSDDNNTYIGQEKAKSTSLAKVSGATESDMQLYLDYMFFSLKKRCF
ncbi:hypothetical protein [Methanosarcina sp. DH2]|jgi:uncharacterized membrane protein YkoI|uniref:hypothetical protein n=1 Tax=Methanosarcina sp. DH2 TaxID=2605639 RepID=UPI001E4C3CE8|nr:hypothetical protein [Methanosarcina sp. DH2]